MSDCGGLTALRLAPALLNRHEERVYVNVDDLVHEAIALLVVRLSSSVHM